MAIRVIIADDHPVFLLGLRAVLAAMPEEYLIVGEAYDVESLFFLLGSQTVDLLITDFSMPGGETEDGVRMISRIYSQYPALPIVVITMIRDQRLLSLLAGYRVRAVLNKNSLSEELAKGVVGNKEGDVPYFSEMFRGATVGQCLTGKELEVMKLLGQGLGVNDIAARLFRTKQTISAQKISAMRKLNLPNDAELYRFLHQIGL
ncbi:response regulator transcription factor [Serratia symbiotica]|uniref:Response regulator transcription factor n=1 Tax=Serratia symbiotica TaxID=138074 RepID=A0A068Z2U9_9GAMM|nr:response regulator transcription factor [Serratia symbiotica]MBF1994369.1 response regulator transcription factor [Serratia symbiotica]MBQ0954836.1 response regulator transcription factor [Serratia symbiotica]QLH63846.1 response regulator transcription factor [Serratia symbiotica]QTP14287.1 response regulator transcription factor [Serratia symbiotica]CDS55468.1 Pvp response regulator (Two-component response regulator bvg protein) [Serratia symbiotica]